MRTQLPLAVLAAALACSLFTAPAHARARVVVASYGNDANPCTFGSPCKTFQVAVNAVDAGGEVTAIDSAGFGPINITKAVTITSPNGVEAGIVASAGADAIDINAGANDAVALRGLTLDGGGVAYNGIVLNSGGSLTITNCVAQNFVINTLTTGNGIFIQPTSGTVNFAITNTIVSNNVAGIRFLPPSGSPTANGTIDHVVATANAIGIEVDKVTSGSVEVAISNSIVSNNSTFGIYAIGAGAISVDNTTLNGNGTGIEANTGAAIMLSRSVIHGNGTGTINNTNPNTFYTYGNNLIDLNGQNFFGTQLYSGVTLR
jgi:hypothetical protein